MAAARATSGTQSSGPGKVGRRAKPAKKAKLAALSLSALTSLALAGLFANQNGSTGSFQLTSGTAADPIVTVAPGGALAVTAPATTAPATAAPATTAVAAPATTAVAAPATTAVAAPAGVLDGSYVGAGDSNRFGTVQVQVVYAGNSISDVQILNYPSGARTSVQINQYALPILINEAITGQTAKVSTVSGATYTSHSYQVSLQSAIDSAKAASGISG